MTFGMLVPRGARGFARWFARSQKKKNYGNYEAITKLGHVSPLREVPSQIERPPYADPQNKDPALNSCLTPEIKDAAQIDKMRAAGKVARKVLAMAGDLIQVGITTDEIDDHVHRVIVEHNAYPSPLGYRGFPKSCCTSVNNVVCHGIPDDRPLCDGDIVNVDVTIFLDGHHGDCSATFLVGNVDEQGRKLVDVTRLSLEEALKICEPGRPFNAIGRAIESFVDKHGFQVVPVFAGHGIGSYFHGAPDIFHCSNSYPGRMQPGMTFTIEPAVSQGSSKIIVLEDGWTAVTTDGSRSAQFEHTVLITESGAEILTI